MPSLPRITIELNLTCAQCGTPLSADINTWTDSVDIEVDPCEKCFDDEHEQAYDDGKKDGYLEGKSDGYDAAKQESDK